MEAIYSIQVLSGIEDYIVLDGDLAALSGPVRRDEPQYLTKDPVTFDLADEGGLEVPDALAQNGILFVSDRLKRALLEQGQDQLFFRQANVVSEHFGIHETLWITVPPRIDCVDRKQSVFESEVWDCRKGLRPALPCSRLVIDPERAGRYQMFRLAGVENDLIYVREALHDALAAQNFTALSFILQQPR